MNPHQHQQPSFGHDNGALPRTLHHAILGGGEPPVTTATSASPPRIPQPSPSSSHVAAGGEDTATQRHGCFPATTRTSPSLSSSEQRYARGAGWRRSGDEDDDGEGVAQGRRRQLCFASSASGQRMKQQFGLSANALASLYKEASQAYAMGVHDARDDIHRYVLDALQSSHPGATVVTSSPLPPPPRDSVVGAATAPAEYYGGASAVPLSSSIGASLRRNRRWIDADELLAFLCLSTLQVPSAGGGGGSSTAVGTPNIGSASRCSSGGGGDVPHTFGRRRPRESPMPSSWAGDDDDDDAEFVRGDDEEEAHGLRSGSHSWGTGGGGGGLRR